LYAEKLLIHFVKTFEAIYGSDYVTFNVHNLFHFVNDVRKYDTLDNFSSFRFENFLHILKNILRKSDKSLQQVARRFGEMQVNNYELNAKLDNKKLGINNFHLKIKHATGPLLDQMLSGTIIQYKVMINNFYYINCNRENDSFVMMKNKSILNVLNI